MSRINLQTVLKPDYNFSKSLAWFESSLYILYPNLIKIAMRFGEKVFDVPFGNSLSSSYTFNYLRVCGGMNVRNRGKSCQRCQRC